MESLVRKKLKRKLKRYRKSARRVSRNPPPKYIVDKAKGMTLRTKQLLKVMSKSSTVGGFPTIRGAILDLNSGRFSNAFKALENRDFAMKFQVDGDWFFQLNNDGIEAATLFKNVEI